MEILRPVQGVDSRYLQSLSAAVRVGEQGERASVEGMGCTLDEEHSTALFITLLDVIAYNHFQPAWQVSSSLFWFLTASITQS